MCGQCGRDVPAQLSPRQPLAGAFPRLVRVATCLPCAYWLVPPHNAQYCNMRYEEEWMIPPSSTFYFFSDFSAILPSTGLCIERGLAGEVDHSADHVDDTADEHALGHDGTLSMIATRKEVESWCGFLHGAAGALPVYIFKERKPQLCVRATEDTWGFHLPDKALPVGRTSVQSLTTPFRMAVLYERIPLYHIR